MRGPDLGITSWPGQEWRRGGSTVWGWLSYDPGLDLLYYGTANPGVWNPDQREGDNLWSTTIFARDPATGAARWAYQMSPHDAWDYDGVNENIVVDLPIGGRTRKVLVHFDRNGFAYTIDRATGEVLLAEPFQPINWATDVDLESGRPVEVAAKRPKQGEIVRNICPSAIGARDQQPAAFSPRTGLFYSPAVNLCMDYGAFPAEHIPGTPYLGAAVKMYPGPGGHRGSFFAWDAVEGRKVWEIKEKFPVWSGALATAGDLVFYGTMDGWLKAVDARGGEVLWRKRFDSGIVGNPISYLGPDGKEYLAVYSGVGGWAGAVVPGHLSPDDPYAALGAVNAMRDLPEHTNPGGMIHVFALED
jgi:PQQ-dependent dehydrogenase (methanol/ethanol family)